MTASPTLGRRFRPITAAPVLVAIYSVLQLAAANGSESLIVSDLGLPLAIGCGAAIAVILLAYPLVRTWEKASVLATFTVVAFVSFGYIVHAAIIGWGGNPDSWPALVLLAMILTLIAISMAVRRTTRPLTGLARYLAVVVGLLASFAGSRFALQMWSGSRAARPQPQAAVTLVGAQQQARLPDIYLIVPDKYSSSHQLSTHYQLNNDPFEQFLRERGFIVPAGARTNYVQTFLALAAMLNLRYLDDLPEKVGRATKSRRPVDPLVEDNAVMAFLRQRGYRIVFTPTAFPTTRRNRTADLQIPSPDRIRPEFATAWIWTTPIPLLQDGACFVLGCLIDRMYPPESAELMDWKFERLAELAGSEQPTFAFIHLTVPHEPYIYRRDCRHRAPYWPLVDSGAEEAKVKAAYAEQILCVNQKLRRLVATLQDRSVVPPVILIQSDHGHARLGRRLPALTDVSPERQKERASVFAAYLLPGTEAGDIPDTITPVNVMRYVVRTYLGADAPPLEDVTYWSSYERPYEFVQLPRIEDAP